MIADWRVPKPTDDPIGSRCHRRQRRNRAECCVRHDRAERSIGIGVKQWTQPKSGPFGKCPAVEIGLGGFIFKIGAIDRSA